jgi:putative membrane protein
MATDSDTAVQAGNDGPANVPIYQRTGYSEILEDIELDDQVLVRVPVKQLIITKLLSFGMLALVVLVIAMILLVILVNPGAALAMVVPVLAIGGAVLGSIPSEWNFVIASNIGGLHVTSGLSTLKSKTVPVRRIQAIEISQPLFWRPLKLYRMWMTVLGNGSEDGDLATSSLLLSVGTMDDVGHVLAAIWPGLDFTDLEIHGLPKRARKFHPLSKNWMGWGFNDFAFVVRRGWLTRTTQIVPHARIQSLELSEDPVERKFDLAEFRIRVSVGPVQIDCPSLDRAQAFELLEAELARSKAARAAE